MDLGNYVRQVPSEHSSNCFGIKTKTKSEANADVLAVVSLAVENLNINSKISINLFNNVDKNEKLSSKDIKQHRKSIQKLEQKVAEYALKADPNQTKIDAFIKLYNGVSKPIILAPKSPILANEESTFRKMIEFCLSVSPKTSIFEMLQNVKRGEEIFTALKGSGKIDVPTKADPTCLYWYLIAHSAAQLPSEVAIDLSKGLQFDAGELLSGYFTQTQQTDQKEPSTLLILKDLPGNRNALILEINNKITTIKLKTIKPSIFSLKGVKSIFISFFSFIGASFKTIEVQPRTFKTIK